MHAVLSKISVEIIKLLFLMQVLHVDMQIFFLGLNIGFMDLFCFMCIFFFFRKLVLILFEEGSLELVELRCKDHLANLGINCNTLSANHFHEKF